MSVKKILPTIVLASVVILAGGAIPGSTARTRSGSLSPSLAPAMYHLGPEVQISTPSSPIDADRHKPAVAYNWKHHEYLVVWHNQWPGNRDIYAQRVSDSGELVGPWFAVSAGPNDRFQPAVAYNATNDEYLVVWMYEASPDVYEIWGKIISWNGPGTKPEFLIMQWANRSFWTPRVAWNSYRNEYLVVWNAFDTTTSFPPGLPHDIAGYRISYDGGVQNPGSPLILTTYANPHQVDLTYNVAMNQYFLAFVVVHTEATSGNDIYGLRVGWDGSPVGGLIEIYRDNIAGQRKHQNHPAVTTNEQDKYMVIWEHEYAHNDHDIYAREYNANGTPDGSYFTISSWTQDDTVPDVAANGASREWLVVWQRELPGGSGYSIHGFRWGSSGSGVYTYLFDVANWTFVEAKAPAVAADIPGYLIVYEEVNPPAKQHIYGRMWWPEVVYLPLVLRAYTE
jgi:hypothetical protein